MVVIELWISYLHSCFFRALFYSKYIDEDQKRLRTKHIFFDNISILKASHIYFRSLYCTCFYSMMYSTWCLVMNNVMENSRLHFRRRLCLRRFIRFGRRPRSVNWVLCFGITLTPSKQKKLFFQKVVQSPFTKLRFEKTTEFVHWQFANRQVNSFPFSIVTWQRSIEQFYTLYASTAQTFLKRMSVLWASYLATYPYSMLRLLT